MPDVQMMALKMVGLSGGVRVPKGQLFKVDSVQAATMERTGLATSQFEQVPVVPVTAEDGSIVWQYDEVTPEEYLADFPDGDEAELAKSIISSKKKE